MRTKTGEQVAKKVTHVWVHYDRLTDLVVGGEVITTTEDHLFWSATDRRFERTDALGDGERVLGADGRLVAVSGLKIRTAHTGLAYNLTVVGLHTYHVGPDAILVHNCPSQRSETPRSNIAQNKQFNDARRAAERQLGRTLTKDERTAVHREISGQGYGYHDIVDEVLGMFGDGS